VFGPDGFLYVGVGDGGAGNDQGQGHVEDWYDAVEGGNGQDVTQNLLGSVLRIDVDGGSSRPYGVPDDNPLVGNEGRDEHYAWGFRNPWRLSFAPDGRLFVADVGQSSYEEVNVVERGGNYGWNVREGARCVQAENCPSTGPDGEPLRSPAIEYPHSGDGVSGISVIGGYLYDGQDVPKLAGRYVFADYVANGQLFVATEAEDGWSTVAVPITDIRSNVLSFGETAAGELLVCSTGSSGGAVHRVRTA
jgi:glucose/arabinose dehydrogenase